MANPFPLGLICAFRTKTAVPFARVFFGLGASSTFFLLFLLPGSNSVNFWDTSIGFQYLNDLCRANTRFFDKEATAVIKEIYIARRITTGIGVEKDHPTFRVSFYLDVGFFKIIIIMCT